MLRMLIDRLAFSILALLFVGLLLFVLTRGVPGSPARVALGLEATDTQIAQFEKCHGFVPLSDGIVAHLQSIALPAFALGVYYIAILSRMTRSGLLETLGSEYVRTARALGLPRGRVLWYALKNALVPVVSVGAMSFGYMFGWALIVEYLFHIPGMSNSLLTAVGQRDYFTMQAVVYVFTIVFIVSNLAADLLNRQLNPKLPTPRPRAPRKHAPVPSRRASAARPRADGRGGGVTRAR